MGGAGVDLQAGTLTNTGTIAGGAGGTGGESYGGDGGNGRCDYRRHAYRRGARSRGGKAGPGGFYGGTGVSISGGTLIASGTISGVSGQYKSDAVSFGNVAGTLVINPGAVFNGVVAANAAVADMLVLGGSTAATLSGLGTEFTGFNSVQVAPAAVWDLAGANTLAAGSSLQDAGTLSVLGHPYRLR